MTKLILVRHGHVEGISPERFRGRTDLALTPLGRRQAAATATRIAATWRPAAIYSSPLGRCVATGTAIGEAFGLPPIPLEGLNDIDYGQWLGLTPDQVGERWREELDTWRRVPHHAAIPGGETLQNLLDRSSAALRGIIRQHPAQTVVVVAHDSVNRVLLLHALEAPLDRYWRLGQLPCAINELDFGEDGAFVRSINETWHLREAT